MGSLKELQSDAKGLSVLYVEDNEALRNNAGKLLKKFFDHVDLAEDGQIGLSKFKKHHYSIVITDIKMPHMDGMTFVKHIKKISPDVKPIVMSAFDDKELLKQGIELGLYRFLKKPVNVAELSTVLHEAVLAIKHEKHNRIFYAHLQTVFDYQSSMVLMLDDTKVMLANDVLLDFFDYESVDECRESIGDIGSHFLEHDGFLYNHDDIKATEELKQNDQKLFHIKMQNKDGAMRHLIAKYHDIPEKAEYGVLSFDDVTELNLLELFDAKRSEEDTQQADQKAMFDLFEVIKRNSGKIDLYNFYKGLSITNAGVITDVGQDFLSIKTTYMQQKALQLEKKLLIVSTALPSAIEATEIVKMSFESQEIVLKGLRFIKTSPITRNTVRVIPSQKTTVSLFVGENKFHGDVEIDDISIDAVKLKMKALPAGLSEESDIVIDMVLEIDKRPTIINTKAKLFRKKESLHNFYVVFLFVGLKKSTLVKYITKRQMELIREIKGMQNG